MTNDDYKAEQIDFACKGNPEAMDFVFRAAVLFHAVDDIIDGEQTGQEFLIQTLVQAMELYGHPFFVKHAHALNATLRTCISTWADSVAWERSADPARRAWADYARHSGLDLLLAVADICGGWEHRRAVSKEWRTFNLLVAEEEKGAKNENTNEG